MLAADGSALAGVVVGEPLYVLASPEYTFLAAEPHDDDPGWRELADLSVVHVDAGGVTETSL